jgi:Beta-propeller repeat
MKSNSALSPLFVLSAIILAFPSAFATPPSNLQQQPAEAYGQLPLSFEANHGQTDPRVRFLVHGRGYTLFLTGDEAVINLTSTAKIPAPLSSQSPDAQQSPTILHMRLAGATQTTSPAGLDRLPGVSNYFTGSNPQNWHTDIPTYSRIRYANAYPGIDLVYHGNQGQLEFDFVVQPGANPNQIVLDVSSSDSTQTAAASHSLRIDPQGDLVISANGREIRFHKPVLYQQAATGGQKEIVDGSFLLTGDHTIGFHIASYDRSRPLVIDPVLAYSTFLGGSDSASGSAIAVDADGYAYVVGSTTSTDFPVTSGAYQTTAPVPTTPNSFIFVTKINKAGSALVYSTYLGNAFATGLALDAQKNAYIVGNSYGPGFPTTPHAFQPSNNGGIDVVVAKLSASGSHLLFSTYLGGSSDEFSTYNGIAVDAYGSVYIAGDTMSPDFPVTPHAFQTIFVGAGPNSFSGIPQDAFVTKLNPTGTALVYSTFLGGNDFDEATGIAVDPVGHAFVTGHTFSTDFPTTPGSLQPVDPALPGFADDSFVTKLNPTGTALVYSTYLGGGNCTGGAEYVVDYSVVLDPFDNAYLTGATTCSDFPVTPHAFQTTLRAQTTAYVTKLNPSGSALVYSTYLGGSSFDQGASIAIDVTGAAYVQGQTASTDFPTTPNAFSTTLKGFTNAFLTKLAPDASTLLYSTYFGGSITEAQQAGGVAVDAEGGAYITANTFSPDFPTTPNAFQKTFSGNEDAFIAKFKLGIGPPTVAAQCLNDEWKLFTIPRQFAGPGDCLAYVLEQRLK